MMRPRLPILLLVLAGSGLSLLAAAPVAAFKCLPIYGHWCGIGHPARGWPPPVDAFDAACMRHDLCTAAPGPDQPCDWAFVGELRALATRLGHLPRPLQWAETAIRLKAGGSFADGGIPLPNPGDAVGLMSAMAAPCW